ncbi:hypothetical protein CAUPRSCDRAFT_12320 [Caulochytrium protostelioides]|uniref:Uncharacterized protein n=1 Tax=Caulochytrium protostelioides TaxID=1555241 RepID=A0A4P9WV38_9FUNG|nr:hypothetical protein CAUPRSCDRAFT_12320 [Caulochytrium protostelioides]
MASWYGYTGRRFVLLASLVGLQLVVFLSAVRSGGHGPRGVEGIDPASRQPLLLAIARAAARCIALDTALLLVGICKHVVARLRRDVPWLAYHLPWHHGPVVHVGLACMVLVWTAVHVACHYAIMAARSPAARDAVTSGAGATGHIALLLVLLAVVILWRYWVWQRRVAHSARRSALPTNRADVAHPAEPTEWAELTHEPEALYED